MQLSLKLNPGFNNRFLFSDHYLANLLPAASRWQDAAAETAEFHTRLQTH